MSLQSKVLTLLADITDPAVRMDIASTIYFMFDLYSSGSIKESDVKQTLTNIITDVLGALHPEWTDEELKAKVKDMVNEFIRVFKLETVRRRTMATLRGFPSGFPRL